MTLVLCALKLEAKPFLNALENRKTERRNKLKVYHGEIEGLKVMVACCGVGMKKAAAGTQLLLDTFDISKIIMSGTAGGIDGKLGIGDTVISEELVYHEITKNFPIKDCFSTEGTPLAGDAVLLGNAKRAINEKSPGHIVYFGRTSTGKSFVRGKEFDTIIKQYAPLCADMESTAVAHVCHINSIPFVAVRSMSDTREVSGVINFYKYASLASKNSFTVVKMMLRGDTDTDRRSDSEN